MSVSVCSARKFSCSELSGYALHGGRKGQEEVKMPASMLSLYAPEPSLLPSNPFLTSLNDLRPISKGLYWLMLEQR